MRRLWNKECDRFWDLHKTEPLECENGHSLTPELLYSDNQRYRARFCAVCRDEGKDRVQAYSRLRGKERGEYYQPVLNTIRSPKACYDQFIAELSPEDRVRFALTSSCYYEDVINRFAQTFRAWLFSPQKNDPPRFKPRLDSVRVSYKEKSGGAPISEFINTGGGRAGVINTLHLAPERTNRCAECGEWINFQVGLTEADCPNGHRQSKQAPEVSREYLENGYFILGTTRNGQRIPLHVAYGTDLIGTDDAFIQGEDALVKEVTLSLKWDRAHGWEAKQIFTIQAPYTPEPRLNEGVLAIDFGWRRMERIEENGQEVAPERLRIAAVYDGQEYFEICKPINLARQRMKRGHSPRAVSPLLVWEIEAEIGAGVQRCKEALAQLDRSAWPADARETWQGNVKMRESGLFRLRRQLRDAGIVLPEFEAWVVSHDDLFKRSRQMERKIERAENALMRNIAYELAAQARVMIVDELQVKEKAVRAGRRKEARKDKHLETGQWEQRTEAERIEEHAAKWRDYAAISTFRRYLLEACAKFGVEVIRKPQDNLCAICGKPVEFAEALHAVCPDGHWREKNRNAVRELWESEDIAGKESAPRLDLGLMVDENGLPKQALRGLRAMTNPLARTPSGDAKAVGSRAV